MASLDKLLARDKEVEINGEKLRIKPLAGRQDLLLLARLGPGAKPEIIADTLWKIFEKQMRYNFPSITQEQLEQVDLDVFMRIIEASVKWSGMDEDKKKALLSHLGMQ